MYLCRFDFLLLYRHHVARILFSSIAICVSLSYHITAYFQFNEVCSFIWQSYCIILQYNIIMTLIQSIIMAACVIINCGFMVKYDFKLNLICILSYLPYLPYLFHFFLIYIFLLHVLFLVVLLGCACVVYIPLSNLDYHPSPFITILSADFYEPNIGV